MMRDSFPMVKESSIYINISSEDIVQTFHYPATVISTFASGIRNLKCRLDKEQVFAQELSLEMHKYNNTIAMVILTSQYNVVYVKLPQNTTIYSESLSCYFE
jgi:hypothetical protein